MSESKPLLRRRHAAQLFKTEICKFFLEGRCESGEACSYAHEKNEVRSKPDLTRTSMCRKLLTDGACNDKRCRFAHSELELRATNGFFKMKMCFFAQSGKCKHGTRCRFAHTTEELRPAGVRKDPELSEEPAVEAGVSAEPEPQDSQIDLYSLSSLPERQKSSQQESHGTGGSTATGNGGSTSGNGGSTSGNASGQSSNENSGSGNSRRGEDDSRPARGRAAMQARIRNQNMAEESSSSSGNTSMTLVPRSEHTASTPPSDSSSSGVRGNGDAAAEGSTAGAAGAEKVKTRRRRRASSGQTDGEDPNPGEVTLIVSNLPVYLTRGALLSMFEDLTTTMRGKFDFFHSPWDLKAGHSLGYAIINFTDSRLAAQFEEQWTNKNLLRKKQPPLKVSKASIQGLKANVEYYSKNESCPDSRFVPLYRDAEGNLTQLELTGSGDVESQSVSSRPKAEGLTAGLGPQDLDTGQAGGAGSSSKKSAGDTCRTAVSGTSRPEERSLQESETRPRRRRNRRRSRQQSEQSMEAPEALQVPLSEKFPMAASSSTQPAVLGAGVQPDLRQLALRQQHQQVLKTMAEKEERKHGRANQSQEASRSTNEVDMSRLLLEAQQLQTLAMHLQPFARASGTGSAPSSSLACPADSFSQVSSTGPNQYMVAPVPAGADSAHVLALHMSRQANQSPIADTQVYNANHPSDASVGAGLVSAGPPIATSMVPCMMLPVQSVQPVQSLQAALSNGMGLQGTTFSQGALRYLTRDEVYTD